MAGEVGLQTEGSRTLHLKDTRRQWQVLTLQILATVALIWLYLQLVSTYEVIDHSLPLDWMEDELAKGGEDLPLGEWFTSTDESGWNQFTSPLIFAVVMGGILAWLGFQPQKIQKRVKLGFVGSFIILLTGELFWHWGFEMIWEIVSFDFDWRAPSETELEALVWPIAFFAQVVLVLFYVSPVLFGVRGIWGLRRSSLKWSMAIFLLIIGIHAVLTWDVISGTIEQAGGSLPLTPLGSQACDQADFSIFGYSLACNKQVDLMLIAVLIIVFSESAFGVIRYLDYAFRLPESCKKDPEYVRQFNNLLNGHLVHSVFFMSITGFVALIALRFHAMLLDIVAKLDDSQWGRQVQESMELQLTYGLVISALLFLAFMAALRVLPWTRVTGLIAAANPFRKDIE